MNIQEFLRMTFNFCQPLKNTCALLSIVIGAFVFPLAHAKEVVSVELARKSGDKPITISALIQMAPQPNGTALFIFPGWPGIPRIEVKNGEPAYLYLQAHVELMRPTLEAAGISTVTVDCPTDQWGFRGPSPSACDDNYRSSIQHAEDVRALIQQIKKQKGINKVVIMGHSYGAISSHWLSANLTPDDIHSAIHSASQTIAGGGSFTQYASSMFKFKHSEAKVPFVYLHHKDDLCRFTPYNYAVKHAKPGQLITVIGGNRLSEPCGKASFHGYSERTAGLSEALVAYLNRGEVVSVVKGNED